MKTPHYSSLLTTYYLRLTTDHVPADGAIDREEAEAREAQPVQVVVDVGDALVGLLGRAWLGLGLGLGSGSGFGFGFGFGFELGFGFGFGCG